jgi:hypothetical protein
VPNVYLNLVSLAMIHVACFVIDFFHDASNGSVVEPDVFLMIGKHLYLQRYKKGKQEPLNGKV